MKQNRYAYMDYLRFFAVIAVVAIHVSGQNWYLTNFKMLEWNICNVFNSISRWGVPVFVMLSGALFLEKEIPLKQLFYKYILRLVISYFVWSVLYASLIPIGYYILGRTTALSWKAIVAKSIQGSYHLWFVPMLVGLYMCVPIFKKIVESKKLSAYFLIISLFFNFIIPQIQTLSQDFIGGSFYTGIKEISNLLSSMSISPFLGFSFYFILGYWLNNIELTKKQRSVIYILGILGFMLTISLNSIMAWKTNDSYTIYYDSFSINVLLESVCIHTWFKYKVYENQRMNKTIFVLSKCCFGAYLVHLFVLAAFSVVGLGCLHCIFTRLQFSLPLLPQFLPIR